MGEALRERLKQSSFTSPYQEAVLSVLVCADYLDRQMEKICEEYGLTTPQYNVLRILRGVYPAGHARCDIIERMIHSAPDVTRLIDRLVSAGLAHRAKSEADGRLSMTYITEAGLDILRKMQPAVDQVDSETASCLSAEEAMMLTSLCERIYGTEVKNSA